MSGKQLRVNDYLDHILQAIRRVQRYTKDVSEADFLNNEQMQDAVLRNIEIIGEAANKILVDHTEFANQHSDLPLEIAYGMRNRLIHGYFEINLEVVWKTVQISLPALEQQILRLWQE
jgi:uncharacterized protein with HEPN domain